MTYVDCFLYAGERWALDARVRTLADLDVIHVAIVANRTHQGDPVPYVFSPHTVRGRDVFNVLIDLSSYDGRSRGGAGRPDYQVRERAHRNEATERVVEYAALGDLVMLSDVDEIPRPDVLVAIEPEDVAPDHVLCLAQRMHPWSASWQFPGPWLGTTIARADTVKRHGLQWMRDVRGTDACRVLGEDGLHGGWHLSWWGTDEDRRRKLHSFSHAELVDRRDTLHVCAAAGIDINGVALNEVDPATLDWPIGITP